MNVLCVVDHFIKFKGHSSKSMVIPQLMGYDRKNAATLNTNFRKNEEEFIV